MSRREKEKPEEGAKPCLHPYLKKGRIKGEKVCVVCGSTIYVEGINTLSIVRN